MPNVREIRRQLGVPDVISLSPDGEATVEPMSNLDRALDYRDRTLGQRAMATVERQAEAQAKADAATASLEEAEANLRVEETQLRIREIKESLKASGNAGDGTLGQIVAILQEDRRMSLAQSEETRGEMMQMLQSQLEDLRTQLAQRVAEPSNGHRLPSLGEQVREAKDLLDTIRSLSPESPNGSLAGMGRSVEEITKLHEIQEAHEDRMAARKEDHEVRMARLRMEGQRYTDDREERKEKLGEDKRRGEALTNTLERAIPYAQQFVQDVGSRMLGGKAAAAPQESPAAPFGPDTRVAPCSACKVLIPFPLGQDIGKCPGCGMVHSIQMDEPAVPPEERPAPAPAADSSRNIPATDALAPEEMEAQEQPVHAV